MQRYALSDNEIMDKYIVKEGKSLKYGYTTGSCAAAASKGAGYMLLSGKNIENISIITPKGIKLTLHLLDIDKKDNYVSCAVQKDSGDDPDITHKTLIYSKVSLTKEEGITIKGGKGIGLVTKPGLDRPVGDWAINTTPRKMIEENLNEIKQFFDYKGGFCVEISAPEGEVLAKSTFNARLGIVGGISILGTSGIVEPMSEKALMDTTHTELDSLYAQGERTAFLCPGNYGADFAKDSLGLDLNKAVKCSNFIGDAIDYAVYRGFEKVLLVGHAGKIVKIAAGVMNTHSSVADCRQEVFVSHSALCGADTEILNKLMNSTTTDECVEILSDTDIKDKVFESIGNKIHEKLNYRVKNKIPIEYIMFTNKYGILSKSENALSLCEYLKIRMQ